MLFRFLLAFFLYVHICLGSRRFNLLTAFASGSCFLGSRTLLVCFLLLEDDLFLWYVLVVEALVIDHVSFTVDNMLPVLLVLVNDVLDLEANAAGKMFAGPEWEESRKDRLHVIEVNDALREGLAATARLCLALCLCHLLGCGVLCLGLSADMSRDLDHHLTEDLG